MSVANSILPFIVLLHRLLVVHQAIHANFVRNQLFISLQWHRKRSRNGRLVIFVLKQKPSVPLPALEQTYVGDVSDWTRTVYIESQ
jgi:hypothetical protein